jgi:hypothetical protein
MFYGQTYSIHQLDYKEREMCYNISSCSHSTSTYFDQGFFLEQDTFSIPIHHNGKHHVTTKT